MSDLDRLISIAEWSYLVENGWKRMMDGSDPRTTPPPPCRLFTAEDLAGSKSKRKKKKAKQKQRVDTAAAPKLRAEETSPAADDHASEQAPAPPHRDVSSKVSNAAELQVKVTNSAADMAATRKSRSAVLTDVQDMDVYFTAGMSLPNGAARKRPGERASKQVAFQFQSSEAKAPASNPSNKKIQRSNPSRELRPMWM